MARVNPKSDVWRKSEILPKWEEKNLKIHSDPEVNKECYQPMVSSELKGINKKKITKACHTKC